MKIPLFILLGISFGTIQAQPLIDLVNIKYSNSPDAGIVRRNNVAASFDNYSLNMNLPFIFKRDSSALIFSPSAEAWAIDLQDIPSLPSRFQSLVMQATFIKSISSKWTFAISAIPRWNGYTNNWFNNSFQMGGAVLVTCKTAASIKYKFGIYYNSEFSGPFFMPLIGIDWRVNSTNNIFGVLPGSLTWEHKFSSRLYCGGVFRAVTNSYRAGALRDQSSFMRIDDNQFSVYGDFYVTNKIVFTAEAGHSVLRKIRFGSANGDKKYFYENKVNDNFLFRAGIAYRLRR